jgi:hypothetical protein
MKAQEGFKTNNNGQGQSTSDRAHMDQNLRMKERGVSNGGGQRSDQTSSKNSMHKPEHKKH